MVRDRAQTSAAIPQPPAPQSAIMGAIAQRPLTVRETYGRFFT